MNADLTAATTAFQAGRHDECNAICRRLLKRDKANVGALHLMGLCHGEHARWSEAEACFRRCLRVDPKSAAVHLSLARLSISRGRSEEALERLEVAIGLRAGFDQALLEKAALLERVGRYEEAREAATGASDTGPHSGRKAQVLGAVAFNEGEFREAIELTEGIATDERLDPIVRRRLAYLRGQAYDKLGESDLAMESWHLANALVPTHFDPDVRRQRVSREIEFFSEETLRRLPRNRARSDLPVFIAGMPRSGTTLVEQIIDAHPLARGAGELKELEGLIRHLPAKLGSDEIYPDCLERLTERSVMQLAGPYLRRISQIGGRGIERVVDKSLFNWRGLGLIALLFPGARVIFTRRDPIDTCLSIYMNEFHPRQHPYASDLRHIGLVHREAQRLMGHWQRVLSLPMLEVRYEELVADAGAMSRKIIEFCGLDWDERCLRFHESGRTVMTLSYAQVSRPIYRTAVGRHERYRRHLGPLLEALGSDAESIE